MDNIKVSITCDQVTMQVESEEPKKDGLRLWTDPNIAVEIARQLLVFAREAGATNIDSVFPEFDGRL